ncbi:MAG TPA: hypothetical protein PKE32_01515 [Miltoncostaeaceae bacterium]|nr:hypothetical protein [Miltoncostaeaceae bacterium]
MSPLRRVMRTGTRMVTVAGLPLAPGAGGGEAELAVIAGDGPVGAWLERLLGKPAGTPGRAALTVVSADADVAAVASSLSDERSRRGDAHLLVVVGDRAARAAEQRRWFDACGIRVSRVLHLNRCDDPAARRVMDEVAAALGDAGLEEARRNPVLRAAVGRRVVTDASRRAAMTGALPLAGADLPVLVYLQMRMLSRLARLHDRPLGMAELLEALAVVGAGFGWRALGRASARAVPVAGSVAAGAVAYAGTRAVGRVALARLSAGHDPLDSVALEQLNQHFSRLVARRARP